MPVWAFGSDDVIVGIGIPAIEVWMGDDDVAVDGDGQDGEEGDSNQAISQHRKQHAERLAMNLRSKSMPGQMVQ